MQVLWNSKTGSRVWVGGGEGGSAKLHLLLKVNLVLWNEVLRIESAVRYPQATPRAPAHDAPPCMTFHT